MLTSQGGSPAVRGMCEAMTSQTHRERMKQALQLNASVPSDPEMCGLQALLPRQSGIDLLCASCASVCHPCPRSPHAKSHMHQHTHNRDPGAVRCWRGIVWKVCQGAESEKSAAVVKKYVETR